MNAIVTRLRILPRTGFCNCRGSGHVPDPPCLLTLQPFATPPSGRTGPGATSPTRASRHRAVLGLPRARGLSSWCRSMPRGTCIGSSAWSKVACSGAGPPRRAILGPSDKRLAVRVEDHPLDYASFQGSIPEEIHGSLPAALSLLRVSPAARRGSDPQNVGALLTRQLPAFSPGRSAPGGWIGAKVAEALAQGGCRLCLVARLKAISLLSARSRRGGSAPVAAVGEPFHLEPVL
jgi:hypothetical protein